MYDRNNATPRTPRDPVPVGALVMDRATLAGDIVVADGLPLQRLYARFDEIARGRAAGDSSAAHRSVIERLASNQRRAEALGWTEFVLERAGGSGRLELRGVRVPGCDHELVPDAIPSDVLEPTAAASTANALPQRPSGRHGPNPTKLSS